MKKHIATLALALFAQGALACKIPPQAYDMQAYLRAAGMPKVVVKAKVEEVTEMLRQDGVVEQRVEMTATSWWRGEATSNITMMASTGGLSGTSCDGAWDFSVKVGEEWLIVGVMTDGIVHPLPRLSTRIVDGRVPPQLRKMLGRSRSANS
jgi:hypothetical protein